MFEELKKIFADGAFQMLKDSPIENIEKYLGMINEDLKYNGDVKKKLDSRTIEQQEEFYRKMNELKDVLELKKKERKLYRGVDQYVVIKNDKEVLESIKSKIEKKIWKPVSISDKFLSKFIELDNGIKLIFKLPKSNIVFRILFICIFLIGFIPAVGLNIFSIYTLLLIIIVSVLVFQIYGKSIVFDKLAEKIIIEDKNIIIEFTEVEKIQIIQKAVLLNDESYNNYKKTFELNILLNGFKRHNISTYNSETQALKYADKLREYLDVEIAHNMVHKIKK